MFKKLLFAIPIFAAFTFFSISTISAQEISKSSQEILTEFCDRRQGGIINLETWYAGECNPDDTETSTFSGAKLGFGDIIILHVFELLAGEGGSGDRDALIEDLLNQLKGLGYFENGKKVDYFALMKVLNNQPGRNTDGVAIGLSRSIDFIISHPPARTGDYLASIRSNMSKHSLVQPAYAQSNVTGAGGGYGFSNFQGFLPMWRAFRNISYFFFVLAFVAYGFAIMFRIKLGQAAVTIQQAIPKLIVTLLLITFSYAIVGLMIDFMWVIYYVILSTLATFKVFGDVNPTANVLAKLFEGEFGLIPSMIIQSLVGFFVALPATFSALLGLDLSLLLGTLGVTGAVIGVLGTGGGAIVAAGVLVVLAAIAFLIAIIITFAKLFFKLIGAYVNIIGNLILAPLILLPDAIPGRGGAFNNWLKNIVGNVIVFPVASLILLFSGFFMVQPILQTFTDLNLQAPPHVPLLNPNVFGLGTPDTNASNWTALIGLALLFMSPKLIDSIKEQIAGKGLGLESELGKALFLPQIAGGVEKGVSGKVSEGTAAGLRAVQTRVDNYRRSGQTQTPLPGVQQWRQSGALSARRQGGNP